MKAALLIDGGYLRASAKEAGLSYDNALIEKFTRNCTAPDEYLLRIFYYDAPQYRGTVRLPISGAETKFSASDQWLNDLAKLERFAVRRGAMGFRGWKPKNSPMTGHAVNDSDFAPIFEQKGVDMRIGLDIATFSESKAVDRLILVSGDTDMVPAMKHARKAGLEVCMIQLPAPARCLHDTLQAHADLIRPAAWP